MMADLEPEDKLFTNEDHMIRIPGTMLTQFSFFSHPKIMTSKQTQNFIISLFNIRSFL